MPDSSFIEKLRMNNIFPSGGGNPSPLINMPNLYSGRQPLIQQEPGLNQISQQVQRPVFRGGNEPEPQAQGKSGGIIFMPSKAEEWANQMKADNAAPAIAEAKKKVLESKDSIAMRKQALAEKVASGKATDYEKFQHAMDLEDEKQSGREGLQTQKSDTQYGIQGMKSSDAYGLQDSKNNAALSRITASIAGKKDVAGMKANTPAKAMLPSQVGNQQKNAARELINTHPEMAQYLTIDPNGQFTVHPDTPVGALSVIKNSIYGADKPPVTTDISLPSGNNSPVKAGKPTAAELLKKYGG